MRSITINSPTTKLPNLFKKLVDVYRKHNNIIVAVDFDDTIYDWKSSNYDVASIIYIVKSAVEHLNAKIILFTCREGVELEFAVKYCKEVGIPLFGINENPSYDSRKPFYNILLDDKACLPETAKLLSEVIHIIGWEKALAKNNESSEENAGD